MIYFIIYFLVIVNGITNAQDCSKRIESLCDSPFDTKIPGTVEEFKQACKQVTASVDCGLTFEKKCGKEPSTLELAYEVHNLVQEVCSDYTLLNAALIDNVECIKREMFDNDYRFYVCVLPSDEELRRQAENLYTEMITDNLEDEDPYMCLREMNLVACSALLLEKECGTIAMHALLDIIRKAPLPCKDEIYLLPALIRARKLEIESGEYAFKRK